MPSWCYCSRKIFCIFLSILFLLITVCNSASLLCLLEFMMTFWCYCSRNLFASFYASFCSHTVCNSATSFLKKSSMNIEMTPQGLTVKEMEELHDDIKMHLDLDRATPTHIEFWEVIFLPHFYSVSYVHVLTYCFPCLGSPCVFWLFLFIMF